MDSAPAPQSFVRTAEGWFEPEATRGTARASSAAPGKSFTRLSSCGAHRAKHSEQKGRACRILENASRRFSLAHRNPSHPRDQEQVVQHQGNIFQCRVAGAGGGAASRDRSKFMKNPDWRDERGGIISTLIALVFLAVLLGGIYLARRPLLRFAGESLVVEDPLEKSDTIIILSDDNFYADRATRAAEIFRQKLAPLVVASGIRLRPNAGIAELMTHDLVERGIPRENILPFPQDADNTKEEAESLRKLVQEKNWKNVIVVTSNYHTRRAKYILGKVFAKDVTIRMAGARDADYDPDHWWEQRKSVKRYFHEIGGYVVAWWELR